MGRDLATPGTILQQSNRMEDSQLLECVAWLSGLQRVKWGQNRTLLPGDSFPGSLFSSWASMLSLLKNNNSETGAEKPELFSL